MKDRIQLSDHFTYGRLIRFTLPSIGMMIFTSIYGVVDGFFVSNFAGKTPFAAVNLAWPFLMILSTVGLMFGTGGSAIVAKSFGEGDRDRANRCFSLFVYVAAAVGAVLAVLGIVFARPVIALLGGQGAMLENAVIYTRIILLALPFNVLQMLFQAFCTTAEKPRLGLGLGHHKHGAGCSAGDGPASGIQAGRRSGRLGFEPSGGRRRAAALLWPEEQQPAAPGAVPPGWQGDPPGLHQRLLRVYEQHRHEPGEYAL